MVAKLQQWIWLSGLVSVLVAAPVGAEVEVKDNSIAEVSDRVASLPKNHPAKTIQEWVAQMEAVTVAVTGVNLNRTDTGLEIVLQTAEGKPLAIDATKFRTEGNSLIADIPNAVLALPQGQAFAAENPAADIATVQVVQQDVSNIRVSVTGTNALPKTEVTLKTGELAYSLNPEADEPDEEIVVTGDRGSYRVPNASTATRTDTSLRDIPQSIQVIPRQVLEDQQVIRLDDALRNVSGVVPGDNFAGTRDQFIIRGFQQFNLFRDGFRDERNVLQETANIERIEVLKGPASVLFGSLEPGGIINIVSKRPQPKPQYSLDFQAGNFGLIRPQLDLTGALNLDRTVLYRLNALYERSEGFRNFDQTIQRFFIAPTLSWDISKNTNLLIEFEYLYDERPFDRGLVAIGDQVANLPIRRILGEPDDFRKNTAYSLGYTLEHKFSEDWRIRNAFRFSSSQTLDLKADPDSLDEGTGILSRAFNSNDDIRQLFNAQLAVIGNFMTGSVKHDVVVGIDYFRNYSQGTNRSLPDNETPSINIFNPVYALIPQPNFSELTVLQRDSTSGTDAYSIYLQDLISLTSNLKLLLGGRFDFVDQVSVFNDSPSNRYDQAFSPRVGLVYQPIAPLSLYASYSRSFAPNFGTKANGETLEPEQGTQYEIGVRAELLERRLITNLAFYQLTKTNIADSDPNDPTFTFFVPIGEQQSRGIEFDIAGSPLPGWNLIASYTYTDAEITKGVFGTFDGNRPANVPQHSFSFWTTYEVQRGNLRGLGFGLGLFFVGERQGDNDNDFTLPSYARTDAALYYRRNNWRVSLNIRNLFDINYFEGVEFGRTNIKPGAPFTILGSVSISF